MLSRDEKADRLVNAQFKIIDVMSEMDLDVMESVGAVIGVAVQIAMKANINKPSMLSLLSECYEALDRLKDE